MDRFARGLPLARPSGADSLWGDSDSMSETPNSRKRNHGMGRRPAGWPHAEDHEEQNALVRDRVYC